jgi:hypothetical protein
MDYIGLRTYKSDSVMSRMVSQLSKPSDTKLCKYWERPSRSRRMPRSFMKDVKLGASTVMHNS